ncbi:hypothetical protein E8E12_006968 [Didymella heteroderae]|uniref:RDRP core domain-containing protein n=1 Tax=Didymella heteroderae TaxID=1769908 RepID=A0A9P4WR50_9PLEO|nr:hypothetical protein E8E12_006968 [Didymella heteroderae]
MVHLQGSAGSGAGQRSGAAPASVPVPPLTPRKKGEELDDLICSLEDRYQLGFNIKAGLRSPAQRKSTADRAVQLIKFLFFSHRPALDDALATFATTAAFIVRDQRANALLTILRSKTQHGSPTSRSATPKNVPPRSLRTSQISIEDTPRSRGLFNNYKSDGATSLQEDIADPGSPTDEDEDHFVTPPSPRATSRSPSPSVTSRSAKRRVEASAHFSLQGTAQKRRSDDSNEIGKSSKLTKISKEKQPFFKPQEPASSKLPPSLFKKPSLEMARSFNVLPASQSTANNSSNTVSSSQQTQPDTANTSFTSDADHTEARKNSFTRTNSPTIGSLHDRDLLTVGAKLSEEALALEARSEPSNTPSQDRDSSSTWGSSLPEEDLLDASARVESLHATSSFGRRQFSPQRPGQQIGGSQPIHSPEKHGVFAREKCAAVGVNQSFQPPPGISAELSPNKVEIKSKSPVNGVTPTRGQRQSPREQTPVESPSKVAHHIRDIPGQGLFVDDPDLSLRVMPYFALFICQRIALERSIPLSELVSSMDFASACADPTVFWTSLLEHPKISHIKFKDSDRLWSATKCNYDGFTFKGQINLRSKPSGPIFQLELHQILPEKSCRFQRKFGADRFLYLSVPDLERKAWTGCTLEDLANIRGRWEDWLHTEHTFLHRKWRVFHIEPMKRAKTRGRNAEMTHRSRIVLFATEGCGITKCTVGKMLNWFLPFARNQGQSFCKAYARFDLGLSRTTPTFTFKPSQLRFVKDKKATGDIEATEFDDPEMVWTQVPGNPVMNDGCSRMSVGAALEIWKLYKKFCRITGPLPSAFQGRIGGAKGLWMISDESFTKDPEQLVIWIEISESQLKFKPHLKDESDATFDRLQLTFEVSNFSSSPAHSDLHISFIPIMADRGVPRDDIANYMRERLDVARSDLLERVTDPVKLYEYVHKNSSMSREGPDMAWQAALPLAMEDKIKLLLESGFSPCNLQVLAKNVCRFINKLHLRQESKLKTPLGKATYLYGVADPLGILKPGEVHVQFSSSFVDEVTDEKYLSLKGHNLLVARQPAIRNSDIQKVRAVNYPELSHLVDLVVFPSVGPFPLAGKLQGGDYDGDIFWLCWEDKLVQPFRNAPAPVESPDPELYGIRVDKRKLEDLEVKVDDEASVDHFLREVFKFRSAPSLLGIVTTYLERQAYHENRLSSPKLDRLGDIHDLLVDAPKQGYTFTLADWQSYLQDKLGCRLNLRQAIHKDAMDACAAVKDSGADMDKTREKKYRYKRENIIDYLYFEVVRSHDVATMKKIKENLSSANEADPDLLFPRQGIADLQDPTIDEEIRRTQEQISQLYKSWNINTHKDESERTIEDFARVVEHLYARFTAVEPVEKEHPTIKTWLHPWLRPDFRLWDRLRASILYAKLPYANAQTFVFQMAGDELAKIKAEHFQHTRYIVAEIRASMKPKPIKAPVPDESDEDDDDVARYYDTVYFTDGHWFGVVAGAVSAPQATISLSTLQNPDIDEDMF